jgi:hypothetical protein
VIVTVVQSSNNSPINGPSFPLQTESPVVTTGLSRLPLGAEALVLHDENLLLDQFAKRIPLE